MSKTPICDKHKYETDLGAEVVPFHVAIELEFKLHEREMEAGEANAKWLRSDKQLAEARAEIERLSKRDGSAKHELVYDDGDNPFAREKLEHVDFGVADNNYVLESHLLNNILEQIKAKDKLIEQMREALRLALPEARSTHVEWAIKIALKAERGE